VSTSARRADEEQTLGHLALERVEELWGMPPMQNLSETIKLFDNLLTITVIIERKAI
jgi:hypothetical protein